MLVEHTLWPRQADLRQLGAQRLAEASAAAAELGVPPAQQYFLGYPDRGVTALLGDYYQRPYRSSHTGLAAVAYPQALSPNAAYTGSNLARDLARVIDQFAPTLVLAAAPEDRHPDHNASGALARRLLQRRGQLDRLRYWIVHAPHWPQPRGYQPQLPLSPPAVAAALQWESLPLSAEEQAHKLAALRDHRSQMQVMGSSCSRSCAPTNCSPGRETRPPSRASRAARSHSPAGSPRRCGAPHPARWHPRPARRSP
jgi:LmbE family N-acetylglucosaminyl deacetylase